MKALFSRLRSTPRDKDAANPPGKVTSNVNTTTTEKVAAGPPVIPPPTTNISSEIASVVVNEPVAGANANRQSRGISQHGIHRGSAVGSSRPPSQFELSLQKPLPELSKLPLPPPPEADGSIVTGQAVPRKSAESRAREPSQSTTATSSRATAHDSQGRSTTLSKQSQSTNYNSVSTDATSVSLGSATPPAQQAPQAAGGGGGTKKVAFISPPQTPGGLSITAPLPQTEDLVADLNSPGAAQSARSATSPTHGHSHSLSKATSFPNDGNNNNALATGSTTNVSTRGGRVSSMSQSNPPPQSSTTKTPPKAAASSSSRTATASGATRGTGGGTYQTMHQGPRASSRAEFAQSMLSLRSGTPYSHMSAKSAIQMPASWSEAAEEDLVSNLGPRERTRQEVLWEIVASEQRYVTELIKLRETFIDPLLHPYATSPITSTTHLGSGVPEDLLTRSISPTDSIDHLPIASRFITSPAPGSATKKENVAGIGSASGPANMLMSDAQSIDDSEEVAGEADGEGADRMGKLAGWKGMMSRSKLNGISGRATPTKGGQSPYRGVGSKTPTSKDKGRGVTSRQSLVDPRSAAATPIPGSGPTRGATPYGGITSSRKLHKPAPFGGVDEELILPPHLLPEDLRICLEVLEGPTLKGHITLCESLRKRYDEQYPLVRSLADVFVANSHILQGYATYVLHLERALEQVDNALQPEIKKKPKNQDAADWLKVCKVFKRLEELSADKGETGLAISLSKPFQRLLKYPLMFQNLLFHTDPSTFEYESTLQMVAEVERIVRSIEDEKIQKEERDQTRDVFARIEGLEKVKLLAIPKPSRVLVKEEVFFPDIMEEGSSSSRATPQPHANGSSPKNIKQKSSLKRLSDVLPGTPSKGSVGGKNDLWLVKFNDVVLRCQRTGTTCLPLVTGGVPGGGTSNGAAGRSNSLPDFAGNGKSKYATTGRRHMQTRPRNLYKFIKIETWVIAAVAKPRVGMVSMEDISRSRASTGVVAIEPIKSGDTDDEANDSDESDRKSKMSFSYWGADKITVDPVASAKARAIATKPGRKGSPLTSPSYSRTESMAKAKFGHRLRAADEDDGPSSVRNPPPRRGAAGSTQSAARRMAAATDDSVTSARRTAIANARSTGAASPSVSSTRRVHNQSTTSNASAQVSRAKVASTSLSLTASALNDWIDPSVYRL